MIYARCYELLNQNMNAFISNTMGIEEGYNWRKTQRDARAELENTDLLKAGGKAWLAGKKKKKKKKKRKVYIINHLK
jgi:amphiphysin